MSFLMEYDTPVVITFKNNNREVLTSLEKDGRRCLITGFCCDTSSNIINRSFFISGLDYSRGYDGSDVLIVYMYSSKDLDKYLRLLDINTKCLVGGTYDRKLVEGYFNEKV